MMRDAIHHRGIFNVIHLGTAFRDGVFVAKPCPFDRAQLTRRRRVLLSQEPLHQAYALSAEDIVLTKLERYYLSSDAGVNRTAQSRQSRGRVSWSPGGE